MKTIVTVFGLTVASSLIPLGQVQAANNVCSTGTTQQCDSYMAGVINGILFSKQQIVADDKNLQSNYSQRAYRTRVGSGADFKRAMADIAICLPNNASKQQIQQQVLKQVKKASTDDSDLYQVSYDVIRATYHCN